MTLLAAIVLNALWQDVLLVFCVWLLLRAWPGVNAATRYAVWSAALVAAVAVPVATTYASLGSSVAPSSFNSARIARVAHYDAAPMERVVAHERNGLAQAGVGVVQRGAAPGRWVEIPDRLRLTIPVNVARGVVAAWALFAAYALFGLILGLIRLERLKRDALPLPVDYRDGMPQWLRANKGRRPVRLCVSDDIDVPVAVGLFDSMILIPRELLERMTPSEVEQISLHELAHLRRGDDWSNCLQRLIVAALGWNPAAIFVAQQLELEREVACDDWVLSSVQSVRPYAMCLTKMAETAAWPHHPMPAPGVFTTRKQISLRIERLLASGRDIATTLSIGPAAAAVAGVAVAAIVIAMVAPSIAAPPPVIAPIAPIAPFAPLARFSPTPSVAPVVRAAPRIKTIERVRIIRVTPVEQIVHKEISEHVRDVPRVATAGAEATANAMASAAEKLAADMAATAGSEAQSMVSASTSTWTVPATARRLAANERTCASCDYHGVDWTGRDLRGARYSVVDFSDATLTGVNLSESKLSVVDFSRANLTGASFRGARLSACDFTHATLAGANFSGASLTECTFSAARLDGANFAGARLDGCDFSGVDLRHVNLSRAQLVNMEPLKQWSPP